MAISKNLFPEDKRLLTAVFGLLSFFLFFAGLNQLINAWNNYRNAGFANISQTVNFTGEGKVKVVPDTAHVNVGLVTEGKDTISVQNENSSKMNAVIKFLKERGINESDIKTNNYSLSPKYEYSKGKSSLVGYILNQNLEVTVRKLDKIGEILDGAVKSGANQIDSVSLFVDKPEELKNKAREEAIKIAKEKAVLVSKAAGLRLGKLVNFSEGFSGEPPIFFERLGKGFGGDAVSSPQIEPGSQEIKVNVTLTYLLK